MILVNYHHLVEGVSKIQTKESELLPTKTHVYAQYVKKYKEGEQWIQCDTCLIWWHRICAEIFDDNEWEDYTTIADTNFICKTC